jgi:hypothetical protein
VGTLTTIVKASVSSDIKYDTTTTIFAGQRMQGKLFSGEQLWAS